MEEIGVKEEKNKIYQSSARLAGLDNGLILTEKSH